MARLPARTRYQDAAVRQYCFQANRRSHGRAIPARTKGDRPLRHGAPHGGNTARHRTPEHRPQPLFSQGFIQRRPGAARLDRSVEIPAIDLANRRQPGGIKNYRLSAVRNKRIRIGHAAAAHEHGCSRVRAGPHYRLNLSRGSGPNNGQRPHAAMIDILRGELGRLL